MQTYTHQVQYYETDGMAVVHHSNFIRWFEEARVDFMAQLDYPYDRMEREGLWSPVIAVQCGYKSAVRFGETVAIALTVAGLSHAKLTVGYTVTDAQTGALRAAGETRHCFVGADGRPVSLKKNNPDFYAQLHAQMAAEV